MAATDPDHHAVRAEARALLAELTAHWDGLPAPAQDVFAQALLGALGSGPVLAQLDGLLTANAANALMYHQAVADQQKTNLLGMAMTARCVRYMLDPQHDPDFGADE